MRQCPHARSARRLTHAAHVCGCAVTAASALAAYFAWCTPTDAPLSAEEEEAVEALRLRALVAFDPTNEAHVALLHTLWARGFPERPMPAPRGTHWADMGWQGQDPATDLRAAGHLSAVCLLFFAERYPAAFRELLLKENGTRSAWEYPFAAGGVNLAASLADALGVAALLPKRAKAPLAPNRAFAALLARDSRAFEEMFVAVFVRLDKEWLAARAGYMDFPTIVSRAVAAALAALGGGADDTARVCATIAAG